MKFKSIFPLVLLAFAINAQDFAVVSNDGPNITLSIFDSLDVQMAFKAEDEHLAVRLVDGGIVEFVQDPTTGNYRTVDFDNDGPTLLTHDTLGRLPMNCPPTQSQYVILDKRRQVYVSEEEYRTMLSPNAATGLIAGPDSLAVPIPVSLPATIHYTQLSHCNTTTALGATIMYSTNGGVTWSNPTIINSGANHASLWQGTVSLKTVAGKLVIVCAGSASSPSASFYTTTWVLNAPNAPITHIKFGTNMTSPAGRKLDGGGVYVLE